MRGGEGAARKAGGASVGGGGRAGVGVRGTAGVCGGEASSSESPLPTCYCLLLPHAAQVLQDTKPQVIPHLLTGISQDSAPLKAAICGAW